MAPFSKIVIAALAGLACCATAQAAGKGGALDEACPSILSPVCASSGDAVQTFANGCLAERAGFDVLRQGACEAETSIGTGLCPKEYLPVRGEKDGVRRSFGNECQALAAQFSVVYDDVCD